MNGAERAGAATGAAELRKVPEWAWAPMRGFRQYIELERRLVMLSTFSIERTANAVPLVEALATLERDEEPVAADESGSDVGEAKRMADLAQEEIDGGFRLLNGHSLVGVWGALETMVFDLALAWLLNVPEVRAMPAIAEIRVPLAEFDTLNSEERMWAIVNELDRSSASRRGIDRFEKLLDAVMLSGSYNSVLSDNIYEMQQVRNVFAHRRGVVDHRFVDACPHLSVSVGQEIPFGPSAWIDCMVSAIAYTATVGNRVRTHFGLADKGPVVVKPIRFERRQAEERAESQD